MNKNPFDLNNKTILVTGSTAGIGKAIALGCSNMGANVIVTGRNLSRLEETFSDLQLEKNNKYILADLLNDEDLDNLVEELPVLDGIVFNAGIVKTVPVSFIKKGTGCITCSVKSYVSFFRTHAFAQMCIRLLLTVSQVISLSERVAGYSPAHNL